MRWSKLFESSVSRAYLESSTKYWESLYFVSSYFVSMAGYWYGPALRRLTESLGRKGWNSVLFSLQWILWMSTGTQYCNTILILQYIKFNYSIISRKYLLSYIRWRSNYYKISNWKYTRRSSTNRHVHLCSESTELQTHAGLIRGLVAGGAA